MANTRICNFETIIGDDLYVQGNSNTITGNRVTIKGHSNKITGNNTVIKGHNNKVTGHNVVVTGECNKITGNNAVVKGSGNVLNGQLYIEDSSEQTPMLKVRRRKHKDGQVSMSMSLFEGVTIPAGETVNMGDITMIGTQVLCSSSPVKEEKPKNTISDKLDSVTDCVADTDSDSCAVCMDNKRCITFQPCGHTNCCVSCTKDLFEGDDLKCIICKATVDDVFKVFL